MGVSGAKTTVNFGSRGRAAGVNGANTSVQFASGAGGNNTGGGSGGGGTSGGQSPGPNDGWNDAPTALKSEIFREGFNANANPGWASTIAEIQANNGDVSRVITAMSYESQSGERQLAWIEYGTKYQESRVENGKTLTYQNGAVHIFEKHHDEFAGRHIAQNQIISTVRSILMDGDIVSVDKEKGVTVNMWNGSR